MTNPTHDNVGDELLEKIQAFVSTLSPEERSMFAALIAPGVAAAWGDTDDSALDDPDVLDEDLGEVSGFTADNGDRATWHPASLGDHLNAAVRRRHLTIVEDTDRQTPG